MPGLQMIPPTLQGAFWDTFHLGLAYVLALPIGWDREQEGHSAGLRTFPIVCVAACGIVMLARSLPDANTDSQSRILQGLIMGIGFVGGGAILRDKDGVTGTATAASVWNIGVVGAAVGFDLYHIAVVLTLINWLTFKILTPLKHKLDRGGNDNPPTDDSSSAKNPG